MTRGGGVIIRDVTLEYSAFWGVYLSGCENVLIHGTAILNDLKVTNSDADSVFGSFRDYFWENSRQSYSPTVQILEKTDQNGNPWIELSGNKSSYGS